MTVKVDTPIKVMIRQARGCFVREANAGRIGELKSIPMNELLDDVPYKTRNKFLCFCDECQDENFDSDVIKTPYYQNRLSKLGVVGVLDKCRKYKQLLKSIRKKYLDDVAHAPVFAVNEKTKYKRRLDGTHRVSVLRYLGHKEIKCACVPDYVYANYVEKHLDKNVLAAEIKKFSKWYQSIEIISGVWTHSRNKKKEDELINVLADSVKGKSVIDLGCNDGLYSFESAIAGASKVIGVDKRAMSIKQAEFVRVLWEITKPLCRLTQFIYSNISDDYSLLNGNDVLIAACVLYHLTTELHEFMQAVSESSIRTIIVQGNLGRAKKSKAKDIEAVKINGVDKNTPARLIYDIPQFIQLFEMYGFRLYKSNPGRYPVAVFVKE